MFVTLAKLLRILAFVGGAVGAVAEAIDIAQRADIQVTPAHLIALGCTALVAFALKWPGDATPGEVKEIEARARRESIMPPPGDDPVEWVDVPGGSHTLVPRAPSPRITLIDPKDKP
jgi:hypothetical protein